MKTKTKHKIYQDSKEIPFWNYKRIDQTGDYLFMIRGYESGDEVTGIDLEELKNKYEAIEQDYAVSINMKNEEIQQYGQMALSQNEVNRCVLIVKIIDLFIRTAYIRANTGMDPSEELNEELVRDLIKQFKIEKCESLIDQRQKFLDRIEKHTNQINKIKNSLQKPENNPDDFNLTDQLISLQLGLEMQIDDKQISLYEFGLYMKKLVEKVEASNKLLRNVR